MQRAVLVEEFLRPIAAHPLLDDPQVFGIRFHIEHRHLVCSPEVLHLVPVHFLRSGPSFWRSQDDHRPARPVRLARAALLLPESRGSAGRKPQPWRPSV